MPAMHVLGSIFTIWPSLDLVRGRAGYGQQTRQIKGIGSKALSCTFFSINYLYPSYLFILFILINI